MKNILFICISFLLGSLAYGQINPMEVNQNVIIGIDTINGTLLTHFDIADSKKVKNKKLAIIIPGSGPTDRNGNSTMMKGGSNCYKLLADSLLQYGISSYRYDKMGVGASTMNTKEIDLRFEDNAKAVIAIMAKMQSIGFKDIYLIGHSEGSLIGIISALQEKPKGFISLAGPGRNAYDILVTQLSNQLQDPLKSQALEKLDSLKSGFTVKQYNMMLSSLLRASVQPYLISWFEYTPTQEIAKLKIPVLLIQGGQDAQVETTEGELLKKALPKATYIYYPNMNHVLKSIDGSAAQNKASYYDADFPLEKNLASDIAKWIND